MDRGKLAKLKADVEYAKAREKALNSHLGRPEDFERGSLVVLVRWDLLEELVRIAEGAI